MKKPVQIELLSAEPHQEVLELPGPELEGLEARLAAQGKYVVGFAPIRGTARWRVTVGRLPNTPVPPRPWPDAQ